MLLNNEEFHNLYSSLIIVRLIESRRMRWAEHVARMGKWERNTKFYSKSGREETTWES
jgi:hypothetical protein